jgi:predicted negative regulator of RcsB-dependent stress response
VDDYLSEQEQWERLKVWLRSNLPWIFGGIVLAVVLVMGWRWWQGRQQGEAAVASVAYDQVLESFDKGDRTRALSLIGELEREHPKSPYLDQAHLAEARVHVQSGQLDKAADRLRAVMERTKDAELALVARLRLARVQLSLDKPDEALATLNGAKEVGSFEPRFQEVRGDIHLAKGDKAAALKEYKAAREATERGVTDTELLDLKIKDLAGSAKPEK